MEESIAYQTYSENKNRLLSKWIRKENFNKTLKRHVPLTVIPLEARNISEIAKKIYHDLGKTVENSPIVRRVVDESSTNISCKNCLNFQVSAVNPVGGMGKCSADGWREGQPLLYPNATRMCNKFVKN